MNVSSLKNTIEDNAFFDADKLTANDARPLVLPRPYLLFLGSETDPAFAKSAYGLKDWIPEQCVGEFSYGDDPLSVGLPFVTPEKGREHGAKSLVIGVANAGGIILEEWIPHLIDAMDAGLSIVSGMHARLAEVASLKDAAERNKVKLIDLRYPPKNIPVGTGRKRTGKRLLTVGTDCALGKKYTALAIHRAFVARNVDVDFRATGQTGIMIAGGGMPMDAVISDFESGAAELLSPDAAEDHWDVIEGQATVLHPSFAAVSVGLLYGSQPDVIVLCHDPSRETMLGCPDFPVPTIKETLEMTLALGRRANPNIRCAGISLNTSRYSAEEAEQIIDALNKEMRMPVADPIRGSKRFGDLVEACLT